MPGNRWSVPKVLFKVNIPSLYNISYEKSGRILNNIAIIFYCVSSTLTTLWVSFGFLCDEYFWCQGWRTLLLFFQRYSLFSILPLSEYVCNTKKSISLKRKKIFQKIKFNSPFKLGTYLVPPLNMYLPSK